MKRIISIIIGIVSFCSTVQAQDLFTGTKLWSGISIKKSIKKKNKLEIEVLHSRNINAFSFSFHQTTVFWQRKFADNLWWKAGYSIGNYNWNTTYRDLGFIPNNYGLITIHRFSAALIHKIKLSKHLKIKQTLVPQYYLKRLNKYRLRTLYRLKLYYSKSKLPLKASPFIEGMLYHYFDGVPVIYSSDKYRSPNGIHRYRIKTGIKIKPVKSWKMRIILYYLYQQEFNLNGLGQELNYLRPVRNAFTYPSSPYKSNVLNPFNNYQVIGIHLTLSIK